MFFKLFNIHNALQNFQQMAQPPQRVAQSLTCTELMGLCVMINEYENIEI